MKTTSIFWILTKIIKIESVWYWVSRILILQDTESMILNLQDTEYQRYWISGIYWICAIRNMKDIESVESVEYGTLKILNYWNMEHNGYWICGIRDIKDIESMESVEYGT